MRSFKQFMIEGRPLRAADRADHLAHYLMGRQRHRASIDLHPHSDFQTDIWRARDEMKKKFPGIGSRKIFAYHGTKTKIDPKHLLPTQADIAHNSVEFMNSKMPDDRPIQVIKHKGKHLIWDGHHRWFRDKLLRSHSDINLVDLDK